jgi:hypothetical protein
VVAAIAVVALGTAGYLFRGDLIAYSNPAATASGTQYCDAGMVTVHSMTHDGVTLGVAAPGPDVATVDVWNSPEHRRMVQQLTSKETGTSFALWNFAGFFDRIDVSTRTGSWCTVSQNVLNELNAGLCTRDSAVDRPVGGLPDTSSSSIVYCGVGRVSSGHEASRSIASRSRVGASAP